MTAKIHIIGEIKSIITKESYQTIVNRSFDSTGFLKVTTFGGKKMLINKNAIETVRENEK
jgi:hypothetical protein